MEPEFSEFYSVAPDRELSSIVKKELEQTISASPLIEIIISLNLIFS